MCVAIVLNKQSGNRGTIFFWQIVSTFSVKLTEYNARGNNWTCRFKFDCGKITKPWSVQYHCCRWFSRRTVSSFCDQCLFHLLPFLPWYHVVQGYLSRPFYLQHHLGPRGLVTRHVHWLCYVQGGQVILASTCLSSVLYEFKEIKGKSKSA